MKGILLGIFSRFFGKKGEDDPHSGKLVANPKRENPLSLQLLLTQPLSFSNADLQAAVREFHPSMKTAQVELQIEPGHDGTTLGLVGWGKHVFRLIGFNTPMPAQAVEPCVAPAHYGREQKDRALAHTGHLLLFYAGYEDSAFEQYVALSALAGSLARFGAEFVLNETAHTSLPTAVLAGEGAEGDRLELIRTIPLPYLFCGFVKCEVENVPGVWMRTFGGHELGLPDFASHAEGHFEGERYFNVFANVLSYLHDSDAILAAGHTMQIGEDEYLRARYATDEEGFLQATGELLVLEIINSDEVNHKPE